LIGVSFPCVPLQVTRHPIERAVRYKSVIDGSTTALLIEGQYSVLAVPNATDLNVEPVVVAASQVVHI